MDANGDIQELFNFIGECTSPYHTVKTVATRLIQVGFKELSLASKWKLNKGEKYFVKIFDSSLVAFVVGQKEGNLHIAAAHTDFPCFRLKPSAGFIRDGYESLNVEPYGGVIFRSWLDRPLSLAGKVVLRNSSENEDVFNPQVRLVDFRRPLMVIPSLAIHIDREVNDKGALNAQKDMLPLTALSAKSDPLNPDAKARPSFLSWLAQNIDDDIEPEAILSYDLSTYPIEQGCLLGLNEEFVSSPRLDNLTSVKACLDGIMASENQKGLNMMAIFDNEEVGSRTKQGAASTMLGQILSRIYTALGKEEEDLCNDLASGFCLSVDVAHAMHPNYTDKSDPQVKAVLGGGVVIKQAASQAYAGDAEAIAITRRLCQVNDIPCQDFVNRSDSRGGSTLGSIASAMVPIRTMDIGVPLLSMHSARELTSAKDQRALTELMKAFLK